MNDVVNMVSVSGGKDSTATLLLAMERQIPNLKAVFADTGNEHQITYDYLDYLRENVCPITTVRANFDARMAGKRAYIEKHWANHGVPDERIARALEVLHPTGNPFLDLCMWKGRFPSPKRKFCSIELKQEPLRRLVNELLDDHALVYSWQGIRWDESKARSGFTAFEAVEEGVTVYRPILHWTAADVFDFHRAHGVEWNPLYEQGMGRVGCMPCINVRKDELKQIALRFPAEIERIAEWEAIVESVSKKGLSTFYDSRTTQINGRAFSRENNGIHVAVEWAKTVHGGRQHQLFDEPPAESCSSIYGLCEINDEATP